jgi:hypothetical protein
MERNVEVVRESSELHEGARALAARTLAKATELVAAGQGAERTPRGGRKAHRMTNAELP